MILNIGIDCVWFFQDEICFLLINFSGDISI